MKIEIVYTTKSDSEERTTYAEVDVSSNADNSVITDLAIGHVENNVANEKVETLRWTEV